MPTSLPRLSTSHSTSVAPASAASTLAFNFVTIGVVGELDVELAGGLGHSDAYVHRAHAIGRASSVRLKGSLGDGSRTNGVATPMAGIVGSVSLTPSPAPAHSVAVQRVAIFVFDGIQSLDVTGPAEVLAGRR